MAESRNHHQKQAIVITATQLILARLALAVSAAAFGALAAVGFRKISHFWLCILISFAAGALLAVALLDIFPESIEMAGRAPALISITAGYALFFLLSRFVFHMCPACSATHTEAEFMTLTATMVVTLGLHSFMDGLAIYGAERLAPGAGILILFAVAYHKFPEGMALALVARGSGMGRPRAFFFSFLLEAATTVAGGVLGLVFLKSEASWLGRVMDHAGIGYLMGFIGGGFVFLVIHALLSEVVKHHPLSTLFAAALGAFSIWWAGFLIVPL